MAIVNGMTSESIMDLVNALVQTGGIDESGNLTLTTHDGTVINLGSIVSSVSAASESVAGLVQLASSADITAGTDDTKAVTPQHLAAALAALAISAASTTVSGILKLATTAQITAGTDNTTAVTPSGLAGALANKQPINGNLTAIAGISPAASDILQYESGAWSHRTPAQVGTDVIGAAPVVASRLYASSAWGDVTGAKTYVGTADPSASGTIVNGSIWFDTSGS